MSDSGGHPFTRPALRQRRGSRVTIAGIRTDGAGWLAGKEDRWGDKRDREGGVVVDTTVGNDGAA